MFIALILLSIVVLIGWVLIFGVDIPETMKHFHDIFGLLFVWTPFMASLMGLIYGVFTD